MKVFQGLRHFWQTRVKEREWSEVWKHKQSKLWAVRHDPEDLRPIASRVMFVLMDQLAEDPNHLSPASRFFADIPLPELQDVELTMAVETEFHIAIPEEDAERINTLGELVDCVQRQVSHPTSKELRQQILSRVQHSLGDKKINAWLADCHDISGREANALVGKARRAYRKDIRGKAGRMLVFSTLGLLLSLGLLWQKTFALGHGAPLLICLAIACVCLWFRSALRLITGAM